MEGLECKWETNSRGPAVGTSFSDIDSMFG